jgi:cell division septum initiation protein DivIVA
LHNYTILNKENKELKKEIEELKKEKKKIEQFKKNREFIEKSIGRDREDFVLPELRN